MKHQATPGPWKAETAPCGTRLGLLSETTGGSVAMLGIKTALNPADVRLIEAAPELLAACLKVLAGMSITEEDGRTIGAEIGNAEIRAVRDAVGRARG